MENAIFEKLKNSLCEFIKIPSEKGEPLSGAPCGKGIDDALKYVLNLSRELGFEKTKEIDGYVGFSELGEGDSTFGILGHVDVVPPGDGWTVSPWCGEVIDGKIFGRGALDDKGPMLAALYAIHALLKDGYTPKCKIRAIFGCDEETGSATAKSGWESIDRYLSKEKMPEIGISPDADFPVINAEKGILNVLLKIKAPENVESIQGGTALNIVPNKAQIKIKTVENFENAKDITVKKDGESVEIFADGKNAHAARADKGDNAIIKLIKYLSEKDSVYSYIAQKLEDVWGSGLNIDFEDAQSGKLTQNVGKIECVNGEFLIYLNIRYPVTMTAEEVVSKIKQSWSGYVESGKDQKPLFVSREHFLVQELLNSYNTVMGENAEPIAIGGGTYARALPCGVAFGALFPEQVDNMHAPDECVELKYLYKACEIYYHAFKNLCFKKG